MRLQNQSPASSVIPAEAPDRRESPPKVIGPDSSLTCEGVHRGQKNHPAEPTLNCKVVGWGQQVLEWSLCKKSLLMQPLCRNTPMCIPRSTCVLEKVMPDKRDNINVHSDVNLQKIKIGTKKPIGVYISSLRLPQWLFQKYWFTYFSPSEHLNGCLVKQTEPESFGLFPEVGEQCVTCCGWCSVFLYVLLF